jgi:ATP-dependent exoDNAse (exonuclease V) beta subunit
MTVHKAKGLEFPIVILADITARLAQAEPDRYIEPDSGLCALRLDRWTPLELRANAALESARDEAEGVRLAYVAATRARDLLVVPAVGDKPFDDGWIRPLNRAIYPAASARRERRAAAGCPTFASGDTVLQRPDDDPATTETVSPGKHEFASGAEDAYSVVWWDPRALRLEVEPVSGIRRPELITKDASPDVIAEGLAVYEAWRRSRENAIERGSRPSMRAATVLEWTAPAALGSLDDDGLEVEVLKVDLPPDRPTGARFGTLVHSVLSIVPLETDGGGIRSTAEIHGRILGAPPEEVLAAEVVVERILAHPFMSRARVAAHAGRLQREVPLLLRMDDRDLIEGVLDLLFEEGEESVLVDFKTDAPLGAQLARYQRQLLAYALVVRRVRGGRVRPVLVTAGA